jgi:hypothetical protein
MLKFIVSGRIFEINGDPLLSTLLSTLVVESGSA